MPYALTKYTPLRYIALIGMQLSQDMHLTSAQLSQACILDRCAALIGHASQILKIFWVFGEKFPIPLRTGA